VFFIIDIGGWYFLVKVRIDILTNTCTIFSDWH